MHQTIDPLVLDLVEHVARAPRPYAEVMEAWRTSCPRLPVWEEAVEQAYVRRQASPGGDVVVATERGLDFLRRNGRQGQRRATGAAV